MVNDVHGVKLQYPSKSGGQEWVINNDPENDGRVGSTEEVIIKENDYFVVRNMPATTRRIIEVLTSFGKPSIDCFVTFFDLAERGYRHTANDWKNIEATIFIYPQSVEDLANNYFVFQVRSAIGDGTTGCCDGYRYNARIYFANSGSNQGKVAFSKTLGSNQNFATQLFSQTVKSHFYRSWTGIKFICYNIPGANTGEEWVRLELWLCPSDSAEDRANNWTMVASFVDNGNNFGSGGQDCGGENGQAITWGSFQHVISYLAGDLRFKYWSVREIDINGEFGGGGGSSGGGTGGVGGGGTVDSNGIRWLVATGQQGVISQSRNQSADKRWSGNVSDVLTGYEVTAIANHTGVSSGGHMALKHWGPNHSGSCGHTEGGDCCCWYDTGIRANGDIQTQIERPHPNNDNWTCTECTMSNIGKSMGAGPIGLKWVVYPITYPGGHANNGGVKIKMWVDTDPLNDQNRPNNNWVLVYDITDNPTRDILADYEPPSEHDIEMRISDTDNVTTYAGGLHWRKLRRPDDILNPGGGTGGGGGEPPTTTPQITWSSNTHGLWNNGSPRTVTDTEGSQTACGKGIYMAASGNPQLVIDGAGVADLEVDGGDNHGRFYVKACNYNVRLQGEFRFNSPVANNTTWKLRNRHGMGGDCDNRFGGFGGHISLTEVGTQIEICHNTHESSNESSLSPSLSAGTWYGFKFTVQDQTDGSVLQRIELDRKDGQGFKTVHTASKTNPPASYINKALFLSESEFWVRVNTGDDDTSVSYRNLELLDLDATVTNPPGGGGGDGGGGGTNPDPPVPETLYNDLTIVYNINSDSDGCICNDPNFTPLPPGQDPGPPPGGGNPGGGNNAIYDIPFTGSGQDEIKMGKKSGSNNFYFQFGEIIKGDDSPLYNRNIKRIEWPLKRSGRPKGTATVVVRKGSDNTIGKTLGTINVEDLTGSFNYQAVENTVDSYTTVVGDRILLEYSGGDSDDYVIAMAKPGISNDSKVTKRDNTMSTGDYRERDQEASFRAFA